MAISKPDFWPRKFCCTFVALMAATPDDTANNKGKRKAARALWLTGLFSQEEMAASFEVSANTISTWKKQDGWASLTDADRAARRMLDGVIKEIDELQAYHASLPIEARYENAGKNADSIYKLNRARLSLLTFIPMDLRAQAVSEFVTHVAKLDAPLAKRLHSYVEIHLRELNEELK